MGEAVAGLIEHELRMVVDDTSGTDGPLFAARREEELALRESQVAAREGDLAKSEDRLREWTERLDVWERELRARERGFSLGSEQASTTNSTGRKVGRTNCARAGRDTSTSTATGGEEVPLRRMSGVSISGS